MDDAELQQLNRRGLIPGPNETEEDFATRCQYCLQLQKSIHHQLGETLPFTEKDLTASTVWKETHTLTDHFFGIEPDWVPLFFSNKQLAPWQGGAVWIFQETEQSPPGAFIQLKRNFASKETYLGLYKRSELVAHECAHIGRMLYDEPEFEEMLAYQTSTSAFRRWLGPLIKSARQIRWFMILLVAIILLDFGALAMGQIDLYFDLMSLKLLPLGMMAIALIGLYKRHRLFQSTLTKLVSLFGEQARAILYRLTDKEITLFASLSPQEIVNYGHAETSLRWQAIKQFGVWSSTNNGEYGDLESL